MNVNGTGAITALKIPHFLQLSFTLRSITSPFFLDLFRQSEVIETIFLKVKDAYEVADFTLKYPRFKQYGLALQLFIETVIFLGLLRGYLPENEGMEKQAA